MNTNYTEPVLPIEKEYNKIAKNPPCNRKRINELTLTGKIKFIEDTKSLKDTNREFKAYSKDWNSLKGNWAETPPPPPALPSDCSIM